MDFYELQEVITFLDVRISLCCRWREEKATEERVNVIDAKIMINSIHIPFKNDLLLFRNQIYLALKGSAAIISGLTLLDVCLKGF